jgi:hypothetical protein
VIKKPIEGQALRQALSATVGGVPNAPLRVAAVAGGRMN